jgi:hypothetical protein
LCGERKERESFERLVLLFAIHVDFGLEVTREP